MAISKTGKIGVATDGTSGKIVLPKGTSLEDAIALLKQEYGEQRAGEEYVEFTETINCFPYDGALAMLAAMKAKFGSALQREGFMEPARQIAVPTATGTVSVPFGRFTVPGIDGQIRFEGSDTGGLVLVVEAYVRRKHEAEIRALIADARSRVKGVSIYSGQAVKMRFRDESGDFDLNLKPEFLPMKRTVTPIYDRDVERLIEINIMTPIRHWQEAVKAGLPRRRVALAYGPYGTGKTVLGYYVAQQATKLG